MNEPSSARQRVVVATVAIIAGLIGLIYFFGLKAFVILTVFCLFVLFWGAIKAPNQCMHCEKFFNRQEDHCPFCGRKLNN